jgi:SAM-dependent methyltransferase
VGGLRISSERFYDITRFRPDALRGLCILDAGCGTGRFSEVALSAGAEVVAVDLSDAVEACRENLVAKHPRTLHVAQASLYELPFPAGGFDAAYCIGVIQHTPDPLESVRAVARMVKPGGQLALWIYERTWRSYVGTSGWKYALRPLTRRLSYRANYALAWLLSALLWPIWYPLVHLGAPGSALLALLPVAARNYAGLGLPPGRLFRCVVLDTLDNYSPAYDSPQRYADVRRVLEEEGFSAITRTSLGLGLRATRSQARAGSESAAG